MPTVPSSRQSILASRNQAEAPVKSTGAKRIAEVVSTEHHPLRRPSPADASGAAKPSPKAVPLPPPSVSPKSPRVSVIPVEDQLAAEAIHAAHARAQQPQGQGFTTEAPKSIAETNSAYQTIDLPSGCIFYPFKAVPIRPLKGIDQAKLHQAATQNSIKLTVEAISATLGDGISAYDLTPQDFYYLMYWQRTQSFLRTPMVVRASCTDPQHNEDVLIGRLDPATGERKPVPESTLDLSIHVEKTTLDVKNLKLTDEQLDTNHWQGLEDIGLYVETMRDIVYAAENLIDLDNLAEAEWLAGYAAFLMPLEFEGRKETLLERMERVKEFTPDQLSELDRYIMTMTAYGVSESTKIKCPECGASNEVVIPFDARSFLPNRK